MPRRFHLILFLYGALLLLLLLDNGTVLSRHEVLAAEPARELLSGKVPWSVQTFAGVVRTEKPPTMSWLIAACMKVTGSRSEFVCRLPAALAGILTAHVTAILAARFLGSLGGLLAGLMTLTTFWVQMQARLGEADMPLVAAVAVAMACVVFPATDTPLSSRQRLARSLLFYLATGFGFLLKMVAPLITIPAAILFARWSGDPRIGKVLRHPLGIVALILCLTIWPILAYLTYPQIVHDWYAQTIERSTGGLEGDRETVTWVSYVVGIPFYLWWTPILLLPTTPAVCIGAWRLLCDRRAPAPRAEAEDNNLTPRRDLAPFVVAWILPFLILITLSAWRHKHYVLPLLPPLSIVGAYGTLVWLRTLKNPARAKPLLVAWFAGCAIVILAVQKFVLPTQDMYRAHAELAWQTNRLLPGERIELIGLGQAHIAFYLDTIPARIDDPAKTPADRPLYSICDQRTLPMIQANHKVEQLAAGRLRKHDAEEDRLVLIKVN